MGKVKEEIKLMVKINGELNETPITISYSDIWSINASEWGFQTWIDYAKCYVNVFGKYTKDGRMSLKNIGASTCNYGTLFVLYPACCTFIRCRIVDYK